MTVASPPIIQLANVRAGLLWALAGQERFQDAIDAYPEAAQYGDQPFALRARADQQLARDEFEAAENGYRRALAMDTPASLADLANSWDGVWSYFGLANVLTSRGDFGEAVILLREALAKAEARMVRLKADRPTAKGDYESEARAIVFMRHNLAYALRNGGQYAAAAVEFEKVQSDYESYFATFEPDVASDVYFYYGGVCFEIYEDFARAEKHYNNAIKTGRNNLRAYVALAKLYKRQASLTGDTATAAAPRGAGGPRLTRMDLEGRFAQARRSARALIDPKLRQLDAPAVAGGPRPKGLPEYVLRFCAAELAMLGDDYDEAKTQLARASQYLEASADQLGLSISRRAEICARLARIATRQERFDDAAVGLRSAMTITPASLPLAADLGAALYAAKNKADAEREYRKLLKAAPGNVDALLGLAHICLDLGDDGAAQRYREAEHHLDAILRAPADGGLSRRLRGRELANAYYLRGYARSKAPDGGPALRFSRVAGYSGAMADFDRCVENDPQNFKAIDARNSLRSHFAQSIGAGAIPFASAFTVVALGVIVFAVAQYFLLAAVFGLHIGAAAPPKRTIDFVSYISLTFGAILVVIAGFFLPYITSLKAGPVELQKAGGPTTGAGITSLDISRPDSPFSAGGQTEAAPKGG